MTPAAAIAQQARELMRPQDELSVATDIRSDKRFCLVGISNKTESCVIAIPRAEWDWVWFSNLIVERYK